MADTDTKRIGVFDISWSVIHKDPVGVVSSMRELLVIGAAVSQQGVRYCAISMDDQFSPVSTVDPNAKIPEYELRMGINPDGSRTHRWVKK